MSVSFFNYEDCFSSLAFDHEQKRLRVFFCVAILPITSRGPSSQPVGSGSLCQKIISRLGWQASLEHAAVSCCDQPAWLLSTHTVSCLPCCPFQVKKQILDEKIYCPPEASVLLASYAVQAKVSSKKKNAFFLGINACHRITLVICFFGSSRLQRLSPESGMLWHLWTWGTTLTVPLLYHLVIVSVCV